MEEYIIKIAKISKKYKKNIENSNLTDDEILEKVNNFIAVAYTLYADNKQLSEDEFISLVEKNMDNKYRHLS